jgi:hypothetical protein
MRRDEMFPDLLIEGMDRESQWLLLPVVHSVYSLYFMFSGHSYFPPLLNCEEIKFMKFEWIDCIEWIIHLLSSRDSQFSDKTDQD